MLNLLIDTCVWIDLAKDHHPHTFLRALDTLMKEGKVAACNCSNSVRRGDC